MTLKIGVVSQKGGVGKSTLCRMIAAEYARGDWNVKIADMDAKQGTSYNWQRRRIENDIQPEISVELFQRVENALKIADQYDLIVFDGAPHSTKATLQIAKESALVILPTGNALDDLEPTIRLAHEIAQSGVAKERIAIVLCRVGASLIENKEAADYIKASGYHLLKGSIPEKTVYRRASDLGKSATETTHSSTNKKARKLIKSITGRIDQINKQKKEAA